MSLYKPAKAVGGSMAITVCPRCQFKRYYGEMVQDPNTLVWVCKYGCSDIYDPYRLPPRSADKIELDHPRPDVDLNIPGGATQVLPVDPSEVP